MSYLSLGFTVFVIIVFCLYKTCRTKYRWSILLIASILFYLSFDIKYFLFLVFVSLSTYVAARKKTIESKSRWIFTLCIVANVGVWFVVKLLPWCGGSLNRVLAVLGIGIEIPTVSVLVPVGISYYVLQAIGYLIDVYKEKIKAEDNYFRYLLFLSYFPAVVQGPISKYDQLSGQLNAGKTIDFEVFRKSVLLIAIGVVKKMVIADRVALLANYCFSDYMELSGAILYVGALCFTIQIYMDFSGCVDICRGVSKLFGIELMDNFNAPYFSKSIKEFWRRWHISLSTWLKDYIYIPLGGNRNGVIRKYVNIIITFAVSGIWHGAGLSYVLWGLLQAIYQIIGEVTEDFRNKLKRMLRIEEDSLSDRFYRTFITFNLTVFSWIIFRANGLVNAFYYIKNMLSGLQLWRLFDGSMYKHGMSFNQLIIVMINMTIIFWMEYMSLKHQKDVQNSVLELHIMLRWIIYFMIAFDIIIFGTYGSGYDMAGFLYGGF